MSELNTNELMSIENKITYSTCFYQFKNKFTKDIYFEWIDNMLSQVNHYYLVIYTDKDTEPLFKKYTSNKNILLVVKPIEEFKTYKYKDKWISNHERNNDLKELVSWEVNMLWNEKINFVCETKTKKYFDTPFYGWFDIGYFRNRPNDMSKKELVNWSHPKKIDTLDHNKIYYAMINNNKNYINNLTKCIQNKNDLGLPVIPIPSNQKSIAGGFFISHKDKIEMWRDYYYSKLELYFNNNYLVKDDQIIVADCIFSHIEGFNLILENNPKYDNWFLFQRYLNETAQGTNNVIQGTNNVIQRTNNVIQRTNNINVSILMPIYNGIEFIHESVGSIIEQTYKNWELLIGINGHSENSEVYKIAKKYESIDSRIKVYDFPHLKGKSPTLNEMVTLCKANYIALLDVDDLWNKHKLEEQYKYFDKYDVIGTKCIYFGDMNGVVPYIPVGHINHFNFFKFNPIINSSAVIRKELCNWAHEWNGVEDYNLWLQLWKKEKQFFNCNIILVKHRIHKTSAFNATGNHLKVSDLLKKYK